MKRIIVYTNHFDSTPAVSETCKGAIRAGGPLGTFCSLREERRHAVKQCIWMVVTSFANLRLLTSHIATICNFEKKCYQLKKSSILRNSTVMKHTRKSIPETTYDIFILFQQGVSKRHEPHRQSGQL